MSKGFVCIRPFLAFGKQCTLYAARLAYLTRFRYPRIPEQTHTTLDTENMCRGEGVGSRSITRSHVSGCILLRGSVEDWAGYFAGWVAGKRSCVLWAVERYIGTVLVGREV